MGTIAVWLTCIRGRGQETSIAKIICARKFVEATGSPWSKGQGDSYMPKVNGYWGFPKLGV